MKPLIALLTIALLSALPAGAARAHEFRIVLLVPSAAQAEARNAFLLASSERDSHPDETSEGHLGGVDSQLEIVAQGARLPPTDIAVMAGRSRPPALPGSVWLVLPDLVSQAARTRILGAGPGGFSARFKARYGTAPGPDATRIYIAARLVDIAVRAHDGVASRPEMEAAILPWLAPQ